MISVKDALSKITTACNVLPSEIVSLEKASGRVLAQHVSARRTQPPYPVSAMDGYALNAGDITSLPSQFTLIGESVAGKSFSSSVKKGEAVRIFTGARLPNGSDCVIIQENALLNKSKGLVTVKVSAKPGTYVRPAGLDFKTGDELLLSGTWINARVLGLAAAMNIPWLRVRRKPRVAILCSGDEIVLPGEPIGDDQIVSSNGIALASAIRGFGGHPIQIGIAKDNQESIIKGITSASDVDLLVTTGGASVGDHDLVREALELAGLKLGFWKISMRPGKPLMFGSIAGTNVMGLPGNPVSSLICAQIFIQPAIKKMLGLLKDSSKEYLTARILSPLPSNDEREDYLRAKLSFSDDGILQVDPYNKQDSSMNSILAKSDCLVVREPNAPSAMVGDLVKILRLDYRVPTI